jgi:hypothetical protein
MTTRRWITAVAIVASILGLFVSVERRRERFQQLAGQLTRESLLAQVDLLTAENDSVGCTFVTSRRPSQHSASSELKTLRARVLKLERLRSRYEFAARYPYLPIWTDPKLAE